VNLSPASDAGFDPGRPRDNASLPRWQRWLLPAIVGAGYAERDVDGGSDLPRSVRDWLVDILLFGFAALAGLGTLFAAHGHTGTTLFVIDAVLMVPACLSLWARRSHPVAVGWLTVGLAILSSSACFAAAVGLFTVAVHCVPRRTVQLALLWVVAGAIHSGIYDGSHYDFGSLAFWLVTTLAVTGFGSYVRARRELLLSLQERARRAEDEQQLRVREAQLAERSRIAREMHDVLAHRISLLSVHAGALEFNPDATPAEIARAASVIRISAREAQEELREVVGVLRADLGSEDVLPPQPTIGDLGSLVEESRGAGMDVSLRNDLAAESISPSLGRTVYRLVQEALTNVRKHAHGQAVVITINGNKGSGARVEVVNRPLVGQAGAGVAQPNVGPRQGGGHVGSGTGLVGLAERVALAGGKLVSEGLPDGGFRLSATLPWSAPE
jgi:signal transduction histidine kinase